MSARANPAEATQPRFARAGAAAAATAARIEAWSPLRVIGAFVLLEWLAVLALARDVTHNGWVYYQGGDQLWYYSLGWLLAHGHIWQTPIGYLWSWWLAPIARIAGPNTVSGFPPVLLVNVLVLLPAAMLAVYGIASRLAGRLFGYWTLLVWLAVPFIGVLYTNTGYHQRYTEIVLPQGFGLTAMADFPTMVATAVSLYFCARVVMSSAPPVLIDAAASGVAAGIAVALKPSVSLVLLGPVLALAVRRTWRGLLLFIAGILPALLALAVWKERGLGKLPLLASGQPHAPEGVAGIAPMVGLNLNKYFGQLSWHMFITNLDLLREHFWSGRLIEWLVVAGLIALARLSLPGFALLAGSFVPFVFVKSAYIATIEDTSLLRILIPAFPIFVLALAALPFLVPGFTRFARPALAAPAWAPRTRLVLLGATIALTAVAPAVAFAAAERHGPPSVAFLNATAMPVPIDVPLGLHADRQGDRVRVTWREVHPAGGNVFYRVMRDRATPSRGHECFPDRGAEYCRLTTTELNVTRQGAQYDTPPPGTWVYRVGVAANWVDDPAQGDVYLVSEPLVVRVP